MKAWIDTGLPVVLAITASVAVLLNLAVVGPMSGHFLQPAAVQGGIEAAALLLLLACFASLDGRWRWLGMGAVLAFYLRRHHVDLPVLVVVLVAEGLVAAGSMADRGCTAPDPWRSIRRMVLGLCLWLALLLVLNAAGIARPTLTLGILLLASIVLPLLRRKSAVVAPALRAFATRPALERAGWALLAGWFAVLMARSNQVIGFDTLWYLTRGQYVLAPNGSFFEPLGMVSAVHYFPKLWELLLLPLDAASDLSFAVGFDLMLLATGLMAMTLLFRGLGLRPTLLPLALLGVTTLPAIAATALQLKTDIAAWMFCMIALAATAQWLERGGTKPLIWAFCAICLACCSKLTSLPYMAALVIVLMMTALLRRRAGVGVERRATGSTLDPGDWLLLVLTLGIGFCILIRTLLTSGLPTIGPDPLVSIWNLLGMHLRPPAGSLQWLLPQDWSDAPWLLPEALFAPNGLKKIRITWTGNVWLLCGLLALFWRSESPVSKANPRLRRALWSIAATGLFLLLGWKYHSRGADGNYFIVAVSAACCLGFAAAGRAANSEARRRGLAALLLICSGWQAALGFVSTSWAPPGTRTFDVDLGRSVLDSRQTFARMRAAAGLEPVYQQLKGLPADTRVIGVGPSAEIHLLPLRIEALEAVLFSRPEYGRTAGGFSDFLIDDCIDYVLIDNQSGGVGDHASNVVSSLKAENVLETERWTLHRLAGCPSDASSDRP